MNLPLRAYWDLLSRHVRPQKRRFFSLMFLLLASIGLQILNPQVMRVFIDAALAGEVTGKLTLFALTFLGIALVQQVVAIGVTYLGESVAWFATNALRAELAWHALNLDMSFHHDHPPGELIERIDGDVTEMASFFSQFAVTLMGNALLIFGILVALILESWRAGLLLTVFIVTAVLVLNKVKDIAVLDQKDRRQAEADLFGFIEEQLEGTEDIRSSGSVDYSIRELFRRQASILHSNRRANFKRWIIQNSIDVFLITGSILAMTSGYYLFEGGVITVGTVYLFIRYIHLMEEPIWALTRQVESFQTIGACVERLNEFRNIKADVLDGDQLKIDGDGLTLTFDHVSFSYESDEPVLNDISFSLNKNRVLGLLGRTGSGKTTMARLIFRLFDPTSGKIFLNNTGLGDLKFQVLRQKVALVTQDVQLFHSSVRNNLTFFDLSIPDERILDVFHELELSSWFYQLPNGLDTLLGKDGHSLSAGEAQLLAFTRVFLKDPEMIILDEASSRLDPATEGLIEHALERLLQNRTTIVIAHRLRTVYRADEIMILEKGNLREHGERQMLASDPDSQFYKLLQTGLEEVLV
jgi:ABC-type multidrug transport system fused ATPase/permease subunit